jgi:hypothetical protein
MRGVSCLGGGVKAERFVEARGGGIVRAQSKHIEAAASELDDLRGEAPADTVPPERRQDVEMPHPAHPLLGGIGIDIEPAHADELSVEPCSEKPFTVSIEPVRAARPFLDEPGDDPRPGPLAVGREPGRAVGGELGQPLDAWRRDQSSKP